MMFTSYAHELTKNNIPVDVFEVIASILCVGIAFIVWKG